jgi:cytochrome c-type biogenesis protein
MTALVLAFLAGLLTSLSPCVLPVLPLVVGGALSSHRWGPLALCAGLGLSFSLLGVAAALATQAFEFDAGLIRTGGAVLMLGFGATLLVPGAQAILSGMLAPLATRAGSLSAAGPAAGLWGNFLSGGALGAVWSPCSGPTLGAAIGLATQAGTAGRGFVLMLVFGFAATLPLLAVAYGARRLFMAYRTRLMTWSTRAKPMFGALLVLVSVGILTGWDKQVEGWAVNLMPPGWVNLTVRY